MNRIVTQNTFSGHQTQSASCMAWPTINGMSALQTRIQRNSTTHADKFVKLTIYRLPNSFWTDRKFHPICQWKNGYKNYWWTTFCGHDRKCPQVNQVWERLIGSLLSARFFGSSQFSLIGSSAVLICASLAYWHFWDINLLIQNETVWCLEPQLLLHNCKWIIWVYMFILIALILHRLNSEIGTRPAAFAFPVR